MNTSAAFRLESDLNDELVVERVVAGETELFAVLVRRYNQRLFRTVRAILRDDAEAEDAWQRANGPDDAAISKQMVRAVEEAIDELPEAYRLVFVLREVQELSTAEVAEALDLTEQNVRVRLHRGRDLLRRALGPWIDPREAYAFAGRRCVRMQLTVMDALMLPRPTSQSAYLPSLYARKFAPKERL